jgi:hypothetical protein
MILFINGFEIGHWAKHEKDIRNKSCYDTMALVGGVKGIASRAGGYGLALQAGGYGYCISQSFQDDKQGNVYSPSRDITSTAPYYNGEMMHYWDPVKKQLSDGFRDSRLYFINGSSDNKTTGDYRYRIGLGIGEKIVENWKFKDTFNEKYLKLGRYKHEVSTMKSLDEEARKGLKQYFQLTTEQLTQELHKKNNGFYLEPNEKLKIVGHSMGCAIAAGVAAAITRHPEYSKKVEVVLYLAPHQPDDFEHPRNIVGYQSSSAEDLVASKNEVHIPMSTGNPQAIAIHNLFFGKKNPLPYTVDVPISIAWAKGKTAYKIIDNIPPEHFIQNKTHTLSSLKGHSVGTYNDEIEMFFKMYQPR